MNDEAKNLPAQHVAPEPPAFSMEAIWQSMTEFARDPTVDAEKLGHLVKLQEDIYDRSAKQAFDRAVAIAKKNMPVITKDNRIEHNGRFIGWFKKYEDLRAVVDGIINPLGLTVSHDSSEIDGGRGGLNVWTIISYVDDQFTWTEERARIPVPPDTGGAKSPAQALGSSLTYGQRYSLATAFGIVLRGLDKDGSTQTAQLDKPDKNQQLIDAGQQAAGAGIDDYKKWFDTLTNVQKGWLVDTGKHADFKKAAEFATTQG